MGKLKTHGGFSDDAVTAAKAAMIAENFDFSEEPSAPSTRSGAGYPSLGGYIEQHFDFADCKSGEKMTFGKCAKVGGSGEKKEAPASLKQSKATAEAQLKTYKKMGNKSKIAKAERALKSIDAKMKQYA